MFYSSPEQKNQTLALDGAICIFMSATIVLLYTGEVSALHLLDATKSYTLKLYK